MIGCWQAPFCAGNHSICDLSCASYHAWKIVFRTLHLFLQLLDSSTPPSTASAVLWGGWQRSFTWDWTFHISLCLIGVTLILLGFILWTLHGKVGPRRLGLNGVSTRNAISKHFTINSPQLDAINNIRWYPCRCFNSRNIGGVQLYCTY